MSTTHTKRFQRSNIFRPQIRRKNILEYSEIFYSQLIVGALEYLNIEIFNGIFKYSISIVAALKPQ